MNQLLEVGLLKNNLATIILAAGKGTRMNSEIPKVLHKVKGKSMIEHVVSSTLTLDPQKILIVVGYKSEEVKKHLNTYELEYAYQEKQKGTAHAVMKCKYQLNDFEGHTLILSGDTPLIKSKTLKKLYDTHISHNANATILSAKIKNPYGYGRIIRKNENFVSIVEEKDANNKQKSIKEINSGIYIFNNKILFKNIDKIDNKNKQTEYYLPDIMPILIKKNHKVVVHQIIDENEIRGANTIEQLDELEKYA